MDEVLSTRFYIVYSTMSITLLPYELHLRRFYILLKRKKKLFFFFVYFIWRSSSANWAKLFKGFFFVVCNCFKLYCTQSFAVSLPYSSFISFHIRFIVRTVTFMLTVIFTFHTEFFSGYEDDELSTLTFLLRPLFETMSLSVRLHYLQFHVFSRTTANAHNFQIL